MIPPTRRVKGSGGLVAKGPVPVVLFSPNLHNVTRAPPRASVYVQPPIVASNLGRENAYMSVKGPRTAPVTPQFGHCFQSGIQSFTPVNPLSQLGFTDARLQAGTIDIEQKPMWLTNI